MSTLDLTRTEPIAPPAAPPSKPPVRSSDLAGYAPNRGGGSFAGVLVGLVLAVVIGTLAVVWEKFAPETWRPTYLLGTAAGTTVSAERNASMDATAREQMLLAREKARHDIEVKDYETRMGMLAKGYDTQLEMQRQAYEAGLARTTEAYKALFERGNRVNGEITRLTGSLIEQRAALAQSHQGGKILASTLGDIASLFGEFSGNSELAEAGRRLSSAATEQSLAAVDAAIGRTLPDFQGAWSSGLPDPAHLLAEIDRMRPTVPTTTPAVPQRDAKPPTPYSSLVKEEQP
jgi:hypothetical protein